VIAGRALALVALAACSARSGAGASAPRKPEALRAKVVRSFPHDRAAFTQGLEYHDGRLYESTGLVGRSSLRIVDPATGEVLRARAVDPSVFAEGLARVGGQLVQLTWQDGRAFVWSASTLEPVREHRYEGEGWGLCFDGKRLVMSDGTAKLTFRDPSTFAKTGELEVRREGALQGNLNELECVGDAIYANVWQDVHIARIDGRTGEVTGWIDAGGLLRDDEAAGT
jgi:glutaminyl-peptide cyclotransferase